MSRRLKGRKQAGGREAGKGVMTMKDKVIGKGTEGKS